MNMPRRRRPLLISLVLAAVGASCTPKPGPSLVFYEVAMACEKSGDKTVNIRGMEFRCYE